MAREATTADAARASHIDAMLLQDQGIGRPMKVGKEAIAAVIAALEAWRQQDHQAVQTAWTRRAAIAFDTLADVAGLTVELIAGAKVTAARERGRWVNV